MSAIQKELDSIELYDYWYEDTLEWLASEAATRGIMIISGTKGHEIVWSGFWSQGDGLAFACSIDWPLFFEANPWLKETHMNAYLLIAANPSYLTAGTRLSYRGNNMCAEVVLYDDPVVEKGFFAGVTSDTIDLDLSGLEHDIQVICENEAGDMYRTLEKEYECQIEDMRAQRVQELVEENKEILIAALRPLTTWGYFQIADIESDDVDSSDLDALGLIKHIQDGQWLLSKQGLRLVS